MHIAQLLTENSLLSSSAPLVYFPRLLGCLQPSLRPLSDVANRLAHVSVTSAVLYWSEESYHLMLGPQQEGCNSWIQLRRMLSRELGGRVYSSWRHTWRQHTSSSKCFKMKGTYFFFIGKINSLWTDAGLHSYTTLKYVVTTNGIIFNLWLQAKLDPHGNKVPDTTG